MLKSSIISARLRSLPSLVVVSTPKRFKIRAAVLDGLTSLLIALFSDVPAIEP